MTSSWSRTAPAPSGSRTSRQAPPAAMSSTLSAFFSDFDDVLAHAFQKGGDTVIALDRNDRLVLENTLLGTLDAGDFQLA